MCVKARAVDGAQPAELRADALSIKERLRLYLVLLFSSFSYNFSFILVDYIRPFLVRDVGMSLADTAWLYTAQGSGVIIGSFLMPVLVSRWGSRFVVSLSAASVAALTLICLNASSFLLWAASRFGVGVMLAGCYVSATTMLVNFFPPRVRGRLLSANMAMFSVALIAAGLVGAVLGERAWRSLIWLAIVVSAAVAGTAVRLLPQDRRFSVYSDRDDTVTSNARPGKWGEMLAPGRWYLSLACLLLAGLNFSGYQFYSGFITTYLLSVRHFDPSLIGTFVIVDGLGMLAGSMLWGWIADRKGRRTNSLGFGAAALFIVLFLIAPRKRALLYVIEFGYAVCLSATTCWGAYFAELFPVRLRPMGTSLFHGGHIISLLAPLLVTIVARNYNLVLGMSLAPVTFLLAALLWWSLPETLRSSRRYRGFQPELVDA